MKNENIDLLDASTAPDSCVWSSADRLIKQSRPIKPVAGILIHGAIEVVFFPTHKPQMVVASESEAAAATIQTRIVGGTLEIRQVGNNVTKAGGTTVVSGSGNRVVGAGARIRVTGTGNRVSGGDYYEKDEAALAPSSASAPAGRIIVAIGLNEAPLIEVEGSCKLHLEGLHQETLRIVVSGSSEVNARGNVSLLALTAEGSATIRANDLHAGTAVIVASGSVKMDAQVTESAIGHLKGSARLTIKGNPSHQDVTRQGSGKVVFK